MKKEVFTATTGLSDQALSKMKAHLDTIFETPYETAFKAFKSSKEYTRAEQALIEKGLKNPYLKNILESAFAAGYNSKK